MTTPSIDCIKPLKVLIADDEEIICDFLFDYFIRFECTPSIVRDGRELYCLLTGNVEYDLILADIMMPNWTGVEAIEQSNLFGHLEYEKKKDKIIFLTGLSTYEVAGLGIDEDITILQKPIEIKVLDSTIKRILSRDKKCKCKGVEK